MDSLIPPGWQAILVGSAVSIEDLTAFTPLEEGTAEGSLMLMRLDFAGFPTDEALAQLNTALGDKGVPAWPGYDSVVYADVAGPAVYLAWQKGQAWMPIVVGIVGTTILPALLGGLVWLILPQSVKDLTTGIVELGMMILVMWLMSTLTKPLAASAKEKPKRIAQAEEKPMQLEEAKA